MPGLFSSIFRRGTRAEPVQHLNALGLSHKQLQDVIACLLLSETVYKAAEGPPPAAVAALNELRRQFPPGLAPLTCVQFCRRSAEHRCMLATSSTTLYLAFMGTKQLRDYLADANLLTALLWTEAEAQAAAGAGTSSSRGAAVIAATQASAGEAATAPAVHRGFLGRAQTVQLEPLWGHAQRRRLRLVLCGHSLGGAVAQLCTLRLLHLLRAAPPPPDSLRCIAFGCPAIGNIALADHVRQQGWDSNFSSIALPEDVIPRLFLLTQARGSPEAVAAGQEAVAEQAMEAIAEAQQQQQPAALPNTLLESSAKSSWSGSAPAAARTGSTLRAAGWRAAWTARAAALLAQRPLSAAAGASRLRPSPLMPAFAHIGQQHHLLAHGLVPASMVAAAVASAATNAMASSRPQSQQQQQQQQQTRQVVQLQLLGLHSMQHYRTRAAAACWAATGHETVGRETKEAPILLSHDVAPAVAVQHAAARLPVLPPLAQPPQQQQYQQLPVTTLSVTVHGSGLEACTGAQLRLPGAGAVWLAASSVGNLARQQLLLDLEADHSHSRSNGRLWGASNALQRVAAARGLGRAARQQHCQQQRELEGPPGLLLQFAAPAAVVGQLQLQEPGRWLLPQGSLVLLSDFSKTMAPVQLQPQVVWILGLDPSLAATTFQQLKAAAPGPEQHQGRRLLAIATPLYGLASAAGNSLPWGRSAEGSKRSSSVETTVGNLAAGVSAAGTGGTSTLVQRLATLRHRLAAQVRHLAGSEEQPTVPAVMLRGQLLLDVTSAVLAGSSSGSVDAVVQQLELAAEVVRWAASRQRHVAAGAEEQQEQEEVEEAENEDLSELQQLGMAARLRRSMAQASSAARRRAALIRMRWDVLSTLPGPDMVVLLLSHQQLLSSAYGEGLEPVVLAAVRRLAAACCECDGAPLLLAVASRLRLSAPTRRQLAYSCGLVDGCSDGGSSRRGTVVSLLYQPAAIQAAPGGAQVGALQEALYAHGWWQAVQSRL